MVENVGICSIKKKCSTFEKKMVFIFFTVHCKNTFLSLFLDARISLGMSRLYCITNCNSFFDVTNNHASNIIYFQDLKGTSHDIFST